MTEDSNPFIHPAQLRFQELLDEAEELAMEQTAPRPLHDPFEPYHVAREWGVDPWVMRAIELDTHVAKLRAEAKSFAPDDEGAIQAFKETAVAALQALVLFEEQINGDPGLDDQQLATFLDGLVSQLDQRIERLRTSAVIKVSEEDLDKEEVTLLDDLVPEDDRNRVLREELDEELTPGLAFTGPHGSVVAGEGSDGTPQAGQDTGPMPEVDPWSTPEVARRSEEFLGKDLIRPEEVPADTDAHDFRPQEDMPPPVDLDSATRAMAREVAALRQTAGGSSAGQVVGRHTSPANTDPDMGETGRRARED